MIMRKDTRIVGDKAETLDVYGIEVKDIRCECGHKLCEVERKKGGVVRIKCRRCGRITRVEV